VWLVIATLLNVLLVAVLGLLFGPVFGLVLRLQLLQIGIQAVETLVKEATIMVEPVVDVLERARLDTARPPLRLAPARDQPGALRVFEGLGARGGARGEGLGGSGPGGLAKSGPRQNCRGRGVGQRGEGGVERKFSYRVKYLDGKIQEPPRCVK